MTYSALEASLDDVRTHAAALARAYNDPRNAALMGHDEPFTADDVVEHYAELLDDGGRAFLLFRDGALDGDGDLRGLHDGAAEFAFMIGAPDAQGKGLGTRYATMIHAFGFARLHLHHIYASIVPANAASRRVFEKLGYRLDDAPAARAYADHPDDIVMSIDRPTFERVNAGALAHIAFRSLEDDEVHRD